VNTSELTKISERIKTLLEEFDPFALTYPDKAGNWSKNPGTIRDRIASDFWYLMWKAWKNNLLEEEIRRLIPLVPASKKFAADKEKINYKKVQTKNEFLNFIEFLYRLIEIEIFEKNGSRYVADWDYKGKKKKAGFLEKSRMLRETLLKSFNKKEIGLLEDVLNSVKSDNKGIFNIISSTIAEEERIRTSINDLFCQIKHSPSMEENFELINEQLHIKSEIMSSNPGAFLRPCVELLSCQSIPFSSGIQYKSSIILGMLRDTRSAGVLLQSLKKLDARYTHLRCSVIYALGNLRYKKAAGCFSSIIKGPDSIEITLPGRNRQFDQPLTAEKCEAVWALGKLGIDALSAIPELVKYNSVTNKELKTWLAWTMGRIGNEQKSETKGIDAGILITLLKLLTARDRDIFEEASFALRAIGLPEFLYSLYLHNTETIPILALKPSSIGYYELSETILYLLSMKNPVIMAVNGDSGTGKTYFCESIIDGFAGIEDHEIVYLQRDNAVHTKIFNRILGLKWLRNHVDPQYYEDYPVTEENDNPDEMFDELIKTYSEKKLIILDGWRDTEYFHQVVKTFYDRGFLDIMVNFRTNSSTRRFNLEEREGSFDNVRTCLANVEKTPFEETEFYHEGNLFIYHLDNSISSRLERNEIREVFKSRKIDRWNTYVRIGDFEKYKKFLRLDKENPEAVTNDITVKSEKLPPVKTYSFIPEECTFTRIVNDNPGELPNLLQTIPAEDISLSMIAFYLQGQLAFCGSDGRTGVLSGLNDRVFYTRAHECEILGLAVLKKNIYSFDSEGEIKITSFDTNTITLLGKSGESVTSIAVLADGTIITGHLDGTLKLWDLQAEKILTFGNNSGAILSLAVDSSGRIIFGTKDRKLCIWNLKKRKLKILLGHRAPVYAVTTCPNGRIVTGTGEGDNFAKNNRESGAKIRIINTFNNSCELFHLTDKGSVKTVYAYFDGRIIAGIKRNKNDRDENTLYVADPRSQFKRMTALPGHETETTSCLISGPRIVTCGKDGNLKPEIKIWGTETYVRSEHEKLSLMTDKTEKPPQYRSLF